jgi:F0F1-type ATP synthase assembly protein I
MEQANKHNNSNGRQSNLYAKWAGFGIEFCGVLAVFCYIGYKLDQWLNSSPWFLLVGFFLGFAGMLYLVIKETFPEKFRRK